MKRILAVILFFAAATSLALGQTADKQEKTKGEKADVERIFLQMERDGNEATVKKDVATLSKLLAEDRIGQSPAGIQTKAQAMADLESEDQKFDSINFMRDLPDREMDKAFFFFKLNTQTKIKMRKENVR
jgi:hypothetical protein